MALEYLKFLRHHFLARVSKTTPSGRQQSAVLLITHDALCLLSNRGGLHTYVALRDVVAVTVFSRARVCIHAKQRHDVLLTCSQQPRLVSILSQLFLGLTGATLPIHQDDSVPSMERLSLRPMADWQSRVPKSLVDALRSAALSAASFATTAAAGALVDPTASASPDTRLFNRSSLAADASGVSYKSAASPCAAATTSASQIAVVVGQQRSSAAVGAAGSSSFGSAAPHNVFSDVSSGLTIIVVDSSSSTVTLPILHSVWMYLRAAASSLPGARDGPCVTVRCVERPKDVISLNAGLLHQTLAIFAEAQPHMVTLQKRRTDEGHHFEGQVFWSSLSEASAASRW